ncbi:MAG: phosphatidylinositol kinase, partial [Actinomycetes bacterium]
VVGVDHGLTFHDEPKLRTVLWGFAGRALAAADLQRVERLERWLETQGDDVLSGLLSRAEIAALSARTAKVLRRPVLPSPRAHRPAIPWPPF